MFLKDTPDLTEPGDRNNMEAVLEVSIAANKELYETVRRKNMACNALRELFKEEIEAEKEKARQDGILEGRQEGILEERQKRKEEEQENLISAIKNLMVYMKWTADQAMSAMNIPMEKRDIYRKGL